jgi:hypothetical protein
MKNYALDTAKAALAEARADVRKARAAIAKATADSVKQLADNLAVALHAEHVAERAYADAKDPKAVAARKASNQATGYGARDAQNEPDAQLAKDVKQRIANSPGLSRLVRLAASRPLGGAKAKQVVPANSDERGRLLGRAALDAILDAQSQIKVLKVVAKREANDGTAAHYRALHEIEDITAQVAMVKNAVNALSTKSSYAVLGNVDDETHALKQIVRRSRERTK